jgi:hypothetical protein
MIDRSQRNAFTMNPNRPLTLFVQTLMALLTWSAFPAGAQEPPTLHPGFEEGVFVGRGPAQSSISFGDVDQDGEGEILIGGFDGGLYGFNADGSPILFSEMMVEDLKADVILPATPGLLFLDPSLLPILSTPTLADVDEDERVDIFFGTDNGEVYRLELILTTDLEDPIKSRLESQPILKVAPALGRKDGTGGREEGDDVGR